jgi:hypothetical protein
MISSVLTFSSDLVQFVQVDLSSNKILVSQSVSLNEGVIVRGEIKDSEFLGKAVKALVAKASMLSHVVLVIPEECVVSKSVQLPGLSLNEIDEAVRWEAEEFLLYPLEEAVLDWKLLKINGTMHVLLQAAREKVVRDYIAIVEKVGVELVAIETPALAMVRLARNQPGVRILLYVTKNETILTLAKDQEVIATSVVSRAQSVEFESEVVNTIEHMRSYYGDFEVKWLQVGGMGVTSKLVTELKKLGMKVGGYRIPITAQPAIANQFLLPISASLKTIAPPDDSKTINLLPTTYVKSQYKKMQADFWRKLLFVSAGYSLILVFGVVLLLSWTTREENKFLAQQEATPLVQREAISQATTANQLSSLVLSLKTQDHFPLEFLDKVENLGGDNVQIAQIEVQMIELTGEISGIARDRVLLLAFKQALEEMEEIGQVFLPVSSFTQEENIPFQLRFTVDKSALVNENEQTE